MNFTEPFLVNPPRHARRGKFSFKKMLSRLGNPAKHRKARKVLHRRKLRKNPFADLMIMNPVHKAHRRTARKHRRVIGKIKRTIHKIISRTTGRGEKEMKHKKKSSSMHRVTLHGQHVSKTSRIAKHHRGFLLNPAILPSIGMPMVQDVLGITAGFAAVKLIPKYLFPAIGISQPTGIMKTVSNVAIVVGVSVIAGIALKKPAIQRALVLGGLVAIAVDLLGTTGVLSDGIGYHIIPPEKLGYQIPPMLADDGDMQYQDRRR
jgi:hypothetical protein